MEKSKYIRAIIKPAVENGIRYIEDNSKRGIRNLLDLGEYFARGKFQKSFFDLAHEMLNNENSFYYDIFDNLVKNTNHNTLTTFGIDMGYNSFTYGANIIRKHEKKYNYDVPWLITFDFTDKHEKENKNLLCSDEIINLIKSGKNIGIYSYIILLEKNDILNELIPIIKNNDDCAFVIVIHPSIITEEKVINIKELPNLCVLVIIDEETEPQDLNNISLLRTHKCLYGGCFYYDDNNFADIESGKFSNKIHSINADFALAIKSQDCNEEIAENVCDYMYKSRFNDDTHVFMIDFYGDIKRIDNIISDSPCFLSIDSLGQISVTNLENKTKYNIRTNSLEEILKNVT